MKLCTVLHTALCLEPHEARVQAEGKKQVLSKALTLSSLPAEGAGSGRKRII